MRLSDRYFQGLAYVWIGSKRPRRTSDFANKISAIPVKKPAPAHTTFYSVSSRTPVQKSLNIFPFMMNNHMLQHDDRAALLTKLDMDGQVTHLCLDITFMRRPEEWKQFCEIIRDNRSFKRLSLVAPGRESKVDRIAELLGEDWQQELQDALCVAFNVRQLDLPNSLQGLQTAFTDIRRLHKADRSITSHLLLETLPESAERLQRLVTKLQQKDYLDLSLALSDEQMAFVLQAYQQGDARKQLVVKLTDTRQISLDQIDRLLVICCTKRIRVSVDDLKHASCEDAAKLMLLKDYVQTYGWEEKYRNKKLIRCYPWPQTEEVSAWKFELLARLTQVQRVIFSYRIDKVTFRKILTTISKALEHITFTTSSKAASDAIQPAVGKSLLAYLEKHPSVSKVTGNLGGYKDRITDLLAYHACLTDIERAKTGKRLVLRGFPNDEEKQQEILEQVRTVVWEAIDVCALASEHVARIVAALHTKKRLPHICHQLTTRIVNCPTPRYKHQQITLVKIKDPHYKLMVSAKTPALAAAVKVLLDNKISLLALNLQYLASEALLALGAALGPHAKTCGLTALSLPLDRDADEAYRYFAEAISNMPWLIKFKATASYRTDELANKNLAQLIPGLGRVANLDLATSRISEDNLVTVCKILQQNSRLHTFNLKNITCKNYGISALGKLVANSRSLVNINLSEAKLITAAAMNDLVIRLQSNTSITAFNIYNPQKKQKTGGRKGNYSAEYYRTSTHYEANQVGNPIKKYLERNQKKSNAFIAAVKSKNTAEAERLLRQGVSIYRFDASGDCMLHVSIDLDCRSMVQMLLRRGFNWAWRNAAGQTPYEFAQANGASVDIIADLQLAEQGKVGIAAAFAASSARPSAAPARVSVGKVQAAAPVVEQSSGAAVATGVPAFVWYQLSQGNYDASQAAAFLAGANLKLVNGYGQTCLHLAAQHGLGYLFTQLLAKQKAGDKLAYQDRQGYTIFHALCTGPMTAAKPVMLQQLLAHQACVPTAQLKNCFEYSPLYVLASIVNPSKDIAKIIAHMALLLIRAGSDALGPVYDHGTQRQLTLLHRCILSENYPMMKIVLHTCRERDINVCTVINATDGGGNTSAHLAAACTDDRYLKRLLIYRGVQVVVDNAARRTVESYCTTEDRKDLLREYQRRPQLGYADVQWVRNFDGALVWKGCEIPGNGIHSELKMVHDQKQQEAKRQGKQLGNPVYACLSIIYKAPDEQLNVISVKLDFFANFHASQRVSGNDYRDAIAARVGAVPVEYQTYDYAENEAGAKALSDKGVVTFWKKQALQRTFRFSHGEQSLLTACEDPVFVKMVVERAQAKIPVGSTIKGFVLDLYSKRYVCPNCTGAILGEQNLLSSLFIKYLKQAFVAAGYHFSILGYAPLLTRVSSVWGSSGRRKKQLADHQQFQMDLRAMPWDVFLQRDVGVTSHSAAFQSRRSVV